MQIAVTRDLIGLLVAEAAAADPHECCGILLGQGGRITAIAPSANVHPEPLRHFEIDPRALIDAHRTARGAGPAVIGYYHSHPGGGAEPSAADQAQAAGDGRVWAIIAAGAVRLWRDGPTGFAPLSYTIVSP